MEESIMNLYENAVKLIGPVPEQFECIYFIAMIALVFIIVIVCLSPIIVFRGFRR